MKNLIIAMCLALVFGCGAPEDFIDDVGEFEQGISAKSSAANIYGECSDFNHTKPTTGAGCSSGTVVPSTTAIKYMLVGTDPNFPGDLAHSWKSEARRAYQNLGFILGPFGPHPWTFTEVFSTFDGPQVIIRMGDCPGEASNSEHINAYGCVSYGSGPVGTGNFQQLTEVLPGNFYKPINGLQWVITLDVEAMIVRTGGASESLHLLMEHSAGWTTALTLGIGAWPLTASSCGLISMSSSNAVQCIPGGNHFDFSGLFVSEICQAVSYNTALQNQYTVAPGVCTN